MRGQGASRGFFRLTGRGGKRHNLGFLTKQTTQKNFTGRWSTAGGFLLDTLPIAVVALLVLHLIRAHLLDNYIVPSGSMEPALHGDPEQGDLVLVDKTAFWGRRLPERLDLVVLRDPADPTGDHLVKRLVAWGDQNKGGEFIQIRSGDLYIGREKHEMTRLVKDPVEHRNLRVTHFLFPDPLETRDPETYFHAQSGWSRQGEAIKLSAAAADIEGLSGMLTPAANQARRSERGRYWLPGHLGTARPVDASFVDAAGKFHPGDGLFRDIGMELDLVLDEGWTGLQCVLEYHDDDYSFTLTPDGEARFFFMGAVALPVKRVVLSGPRVQIAFGYMDGHLFFVVGGRKVFHFASDLTKEDALDYRMHNLLHAAVAGAGAKVERVRLFHDVHYRSLLAGPDGWGEPHHVEPGQLWLLGDNASGSRDSRHLGPYPSHHLVGRPVAILRPASRRRWLGPR